MSRTERSIAIAQARCLWQSIFALAFAVVSCFTIAHAADAPIDSSDTDSNVGYFAQPKYIGSVYCYACHLDLSREFTKTKMGRLFQIRPDNDLERRGCEGCHGPGSNHAITGGGLGIGGLVEFRIDRGQPIEKANQVCISCHDEAFWHGKTDGTRQLACFDCHVVMTRMSCAGQLAPPEVTPWNTRHTWRLAIGAGLLAGLLTGTVRRDWGRKPRDNVDGLA